MDFRDVVEPAPRESTNVAASPLETGTGSVVVHRRGAQRRFDWLGGMRQHVPQQEDQDADRRGVEERSQAGSGLLIRPIGSPR